MGEKVTANSGKKPAEQDLCDTCGKPLTYIGAYNAWYCYPCQKYAPPKPGQQYQYPQQHQQAQAAQGQYAVTQPSGAASAEYTQQAFATGYDSYSAGGEAAASPKTEGRAPATKCPKCGAPLPASGECAHCRARELLAGAEDRMMVAANSGVEVRKVELLVRQARNSLDEGNFGEAKVTAERAAAMMEELQSQFIKSNEQIAEAGKVVEEFRGRAVDVGQAESLIQLAQSFLKTGNYEKAIAYAKKAIKTAREAQTREVAEKAIEERPPLPPAVAKPVDALSEGVAKPTILATAGHPLPKPVIVPAEAEPAAKKPEAPAVCPSCGETVEPGWKRCPSCTSPVGQAAAGGPGAAPPAKSERPTGEKREEAAPKDEEAKPAPAPKPAAEKPEGKDPEYLVADKEIKEVEAELENLEKAGQNVAHARNLLKLAISFLRGGSYEKATRYARKVKNVLSEKKP